MSDGYADCCDSGNRVSVRSNAMKAAFVVILFAASAFTQDQAAITAAQAVCGPGNVRFDAKADSTQHPTPQPDPAKATV
jgi:hypothetical protein